MRRLRLVAIAVALLAPAGWAESGVRVSVAGSTIAGVKAKAVARLDLTGRDALCVSLSGTDLRIRYDKVNALEYGQNVSRRFAAAILINPVLLLSKSRKHFITLGYTDEQQGQQAIVFRVDKGDIRALLAGLEARTGRRIEYQDNEARRSPR